jgi:hypothetical protein
VGHANGVRGLENEIPAATGGIEIIDLVGLPMMELRRRVASLTDRTAIVYTRINSDGHGTHCSPVEALGLFAEGANAPVVAPLSSPRPVRTGRLKCPLTAVISNNWPSLLVTPAKTFESVQIFRLQRLASCGRRIGLAAIRKRGRSAYGKYRSVTHDCSSSSRVSARSLNTARLNFTPREFDLG